MKKNEMPRQEERKDFFDARTNIDDYKLKEATRYIMRYLNRLYCPKNAFITFITFRHITFWKPPQPLPPRLT